MLLRHISLVLSFTKCVASIAAVFVLRSAGPSSCFVRFCEEVLALFSRLSVWDNNYCSSFTVCYTGVCFNKCTMRDAVLFSRGFEINFGAIK